MSTGKRRVYSREFKVSAVKRALAGESVAALSHELGVRSGQLYKWSRHYRAGGEGALRPACRPRKGTGVLDRGASKDLELGPSKDPATARKRISELERKIGQQQLELDFFRRALRQVEEARRPNEGPGARASTRSSRR